MMGFGLFGVDPWLCSDHSRLAEGESCPSVARCQHQEGASFLRGQFLPLDPDPDLFSLPVPFTILHLHTPAMMCKIELVACAETQHQRRREIIVENLTNLPLPTGHGNVDEATGVGYPLLRTSLGGLLLLLWLHLYRRQISNRQGFRPRGAKLKTAVYKVTEA